MAKAFAAAQPKSMLHRLSHARRASFWSSSGKSRTLAHAKEDKKSTVSFDHRPPTSAPSTTNRALPPARAVMRETPFSVKRSVPLIKQHLSSATWKPRSSSSRLERLDDMRRDSTVSKAAAARPVSPQVASRRRGQWSKRRGPRNFGGSVLGCQIASLPHCISCEVTSGIRLNNKLTQSLAMVGGPSSHHAHNCDASWKVTMVSAEEQTPRCHVPAMWRIGNAIQGSSGALRPELNTNGDIHLIQKV